MNNVPPVVAWLSSDQAVSANGEVFLVEGDSVTRYEPWRIGQTISNPGRWSAEFAGESISTLLAER